MGVLDTSSLFSGSTGSSATTGVPAYVLVNGTAMYLIKDSKGYFYYKGGGYVGAPTKVYVYDLNGKAVTSQSGIVLPIAGWSGSLPAAGSSAGIGSARAYRNGTHQGIDMSAALGTPLVAVVSGRVESVHTSTNGGKIVWLRGDDGRLYKYMHMDSWAVSEGQYVDQGDVLGTVGQTGAASGPHLHFEVWDENGNMLDPTKVLSGSSSVDAGDVAYPPGYGTGGADYTSVYESINDIFQYYLGRDATSAEKEQARTWSGDHVLRYIKTLPEWSTSPGYDRLRAAVQSRWTDLIGGVAPSDFIAEAIAGDWSDEQIDEKIRAHASYKTGREYETNRIAYIDAWETKIGFDLTDTAKTTLDTALANGWTMSMWEDWIEQQPEYETGVEVQGKVSTVLNQLDGLWGRGTVDAKLAADPDYVKNTVWAELGKDASPQAIDRWARKQPEWMSGPEAANSRVTLDDYYRSIMRTAPKSADLDQWVRDGLTTDQLLLKLRETPEYKSTYAAKMPWQTEKEFIYERDAFNAVGRWYFQNDDFAYSASQLQYFFEHGIDADEMDQRYQWTEQAAAELLDTKGTWAYALEAMGITLTEAMAYTIASGAQGSGDLMALITQGQNRRAFDEAFHTYTGNWPTAADYAYLESNFVGPTEYAARMAAREQATEQFPAINEMFRRVYGYEADLGKVETWLLGGEGGGTYGALIQAAEELDRYTLTWREYARTDPTPQQYAEWAGFAGPSELAKLLNARELVAQNGREIMDVYNSYWVAMGALPITEDDVFTLEGQYQGWGAIDARLQMAAKHRQRQQEARRQALSGITAQAYTVATQFGGPQTPFLTRPQG